MNIIPRVNMLQKKYGFVDIANVVILHSGRSNRAGKKYTVKVQYKGNVKTLHFGSSTYPHYYDKWRSYTNLNHNDKLRRINYLARSSGITNKHGRKVINNPFSPAFWSGRVLW
jgi:hypothetical protein